MPLARGPSPGCFPCRRLPLLPTLSLGLGRPFVPCFLCVPILVFRGASGAAPKPVGSLRKESRGAGVSARPAGGEPGKQSGERTL